MYGQEVWNTQGWNECGSKVPEKRWYPGYGLRYHDKRIGKMGKGRTNWFCRSRRQWLWWFHGRSFRSRCYFRQYRWCYGSGTQNGIWIHHKRESTGTTIQSYPCQRVWRCQRSDYKNRWFRCKCCYRLWNCECRKTNWADKKRKQTVSFYWSHDLSRGLYRRRWTTQGCYEGQGWSQKSKNSKFIYEGWSDDCQKESWESWYYKNIWRVLRWTFKRFSGTNVTYFVRG